ncbi:flagellar motor switch protein FliN [Mesorhizobium sp. CAU 1741]|uniref:flagellar motor switch protein FliN n=1 Tax=Mesorhizobium sp. CAU 1741 TaxID=3140366 RepID=UPI00325A6EFB
MSSSIPDFDKLGDLGSFGDEATPTLGDDPQEEDLNKAIEELRGVLQDEESVETSGSDSFASAYSKPVKASGVANNDIIMNIPVDVQIVLGSAEMPVSELMALQKGSTVALNRRIGEPVDVVVNGRKIATGEITVLESDPSRFGIKLTKIIDAAKTG